jgi:hypothetical protein
MYEWEFAIGIHLSQFLRFPLNLIKKTNAENWDPMDLYALDSLQK